MLSAYAMECLAGWPLLFAGGDIRCTDIEAVI